MNPEGRTVADIMTIGENIKKAREHAGMTQVDVHIATGIPVQTYKAYEAGTRPPPADRIGAIAKALKVSADELVFDPEERDINQELRAVFRRMALLPEDLKGQAKMMMRAMVLGLEEEAAKREGHAA